VKGRFDMNKLKEISENIGEYSDYKIEKGIELYTNRKYNICIKMEKGIYTQKQADKNYERASKICNLFYEEKRRRMLEQDKIFKGFIEVLKEQQPFQLIKKS
jgi:hypothetical protein